MKQTTKLVAYLTFMLVLIAGVLVFAGSAEHKNCPVCNHSIASEGKTNFSPITINK